MAEQIETVLKRTLYVLVRQLGLTPEEVAQLRLAHLHLAGQKPNLNFIPVGRRETKTVELDMDAHRALVGWLVVRPDSVSDFLFPGQKTAAIKPDEIRRIIGPEPRKPEPPPSPAPPDKNISRPVPPPSRPERGAPPPGMSAPATFRPPSGPPEADESVNIPLPKAARRKPTVPVDEEQLEPLPRARSKPSLRTEPSPPAQPETIHPEPDSEVSPPQPVPAQQESPEPETPSQEEEPAPETAPAKDTATAKRPSTKPSVPVKPVGPPPSQEKPTAAAPPKTDEKPVAPATEEEKPAISPKAAEQPAVPTTQTAQQAATQTRPIWSRFMAIGLGGLGLIAVVLCVICGAGGWLVMQSETVSSIFATETVVEEEPTPEEAVAFATEAVPDSPLPSPTLPPTSTPTPLPPTNTPEPTATDTPPSPTDTPLAPTDTPEPTPTDTPEPPTDTPEPSTEPTETPTPAPVMKYDAPVLIEPEDGYRFIPGNTIVLRWQPVGGYTEDGQAVQLAPDEKYAVRLVYQYQGETTYGGANVRESQWTIPLSLHGQVDGPEYKYEWFVVVERQNDDGSAVAISPESARRTFYWR